MCFSSFCYKYIDSTNLFQFLFSVKAKVTLFEFVILVIGFIFFSLLEIDKYLKRKSTSKSPEFIDFENLFVKKRFSKVDLEILFVDSGKKKKNHVMILMIVANTKFM